MPQASEKVGADSPQMYIKQMQSYSDGNFYMTFANSHPLASIAYAFYSFPVYLNKQSIFHSCKIDL